jgi:DNA-binding NarL/FixJ family response regulator
MKAKNTKIRILLADDHPLIRSGIRLFIQDAPNIYIIGEASDGNEVYEFCKKSEFDILILDIRMPGPTCRDIISHVNFKYPKISILILSAFEDDIYIRTLISLGVKGYVLKNEAPEVLTDAIYAISDGKTWFSQKIVNKIVGSSLQPRRLSPTQREVEILRLVREGLTYREIGDKLSITPRTTRFHMANILTKLSARNRIEAISKALEKGWIS